MDIFVIEIIDADSVHQKLLLEFKKKEISNPKKLNQHCLSYLMVDRILREFYKIDDREVTFEGNKPKLKSGAKRFSISHSGDYIAPAIPLKNFTLNGPSLRQNTNSAALRVPLKPIGSAIIPSLR